MIDLLIGGSRVATIEGYRGPSANDADGSACSFTLPYAPSLPLIGVRSAQLAYPGGVVKQLTITRVEVNRVTHLVGVVGYVT